MVRILFCLIFGTLYLVSCKDERSTLINSATPEETINLLTDLPAFTEDSLVNVVIEIPAGSNQKWELNKQTGQIEWNQITQDSFRIIDYLAYPSNYGFVPQTLLPKISGGDGDPVDVFVLGPSLSRTTQVKVRIIGIIHMLDNNESDSKLIAVNVGEKGFDVHSLEMLNTNYPGIIDIIEIWLSQYKGKDKINIISVNNESEAMQYLIKAHSDFINQKN
jgi:inorganic pyrophosphatase